MGGRRDRWPLGRGFERFYGFLGGETDQYHPDLVYDNHQVDPPRTPEEGYHLTEDLADHAIEFVKDLRAVAPDKPFFLWFAPGRVPRAAPGAGRLHRRATAATSTRAGTRWRERGLRPPARVGPAARRAPSCRERPSWVPAVGLARRTTSGASTPA